MPPTDRVVPTGMHRSTFEYLVRTLSTRTAGKKYENYVLHQLWFALNDPELQPVAQQFVNRRALDPAVGLSNFAMATPDDDDPHRAFIDLYFPQLHLGVECDENHHARPRNADADAERRRDIARVIPDYEELRIRVETGDDGLPVDPSIVFSTLAHAVERIRARKKEVMAESFEWARFAPWQTHLPDWQRALAAGRLRAGDELFFANNGQVRELFGRGDGTGTASSSFSGDFRLADTGYAVWMPTLSEADGAGVYRSTNSKGLLNVLFTDGDDVVIGQADPTPDSFRAYETAREANSARRKIGEGTLPLPALAYTLTPEDYRRAARPSYWDHVHRLTFAKTRDAIGRAGYRFIGVFRSDGGFRQDPNGVWFQTCRLVASDVDLRLFSPHANASGGDRRD